MSKEAALALDRNTVSALNPFIGINTEETLDQCSGVISDIGYVLSASSQSGIEMDIANLFRVFETIYFAMKYESNALAKQKEASHV